MPDFDLVKIVAYGGAKRGHTNSWNILMKLSGITYEDLLWLYGRNRNDSYYGKAIK